MSIIRGLFGFPLQCKFIYCKICFENLYTGSPYEHVLIAYLGLWAICSLLLANKGPQSLLFWAPSLPAAIHYWASLGACRSAENHTTCCTLSCLHISLLLLLKLPSTKACSISLRELPLLSDLKRLYIMISQTN